MTDSPLISTAELASLLDDPALRIVDGSWHLDGHDARADFDAGRLPGAVFFDLEGVSDHTSNLPHMLPDAAVFAEAVGALGIARTDTVVVYDTSGLFSAARVWWTFHVMGATSVRVLDGGLPKWRAEGRATASGPVTPPSAACFQTVTTRNRLALIDDVVNALGTSVQIVDARPAARFHGQTPEPRADLRAGHMPGAINLPIGLLKTADGTMKRGLALKTAFTDAGVDLDLPIITSCGSGVTAAVLTLALAELGTDSRLYDGSWAEWGARADTPVVLG